MGPDSTLYNTPNPAFDAEYNYASSNTHESQPYVEVDDITSTTHADDDVQDEHDVEDTATYTRSPGAFTPFLTKELQAKAWMDLRQLADDKKGLGVTYSQVSDVYSYWVVMWEIVHCELPFDEALAEPTCKTHVDRRDAILQVMTADDEPAIMFWSARDQNKSIKKYPCSEVFNRLMHACLNDPQERPDFQTICDEQNEAQTWQISEARVKFSNEKEPLKKSFLGLAFIGVLDGNKEVCSDTSSSLFYSPFWRQ